MVDSMNSTFSKLASENFERRPYKLPKLPNDHPSQLSMNHAAASVKSGKSNVQGKSAAFGKQS